MDSTFSNREAAEIAKEHIDFSFGANWKKLIDRLDPRQIESARKSLLDFSGRSDFRGVTFLDVGSGNGIFSFAVHGLGAEQITSVDIDPNSIECTTEMRRRAGEPPNWRVVPGSALDERFMGTIPQHDFVYCWGVLMCSGDMWRGVRNVAGRVKPGGVLWLATYNKTWATGPWRVIKRVFNRTPRFLRPLFMAFFGALHIVKLTLSFQNPVKFIREYWKHSRGMSWWRDWEDWLGGLPYEAATVEETDKVLREHGLEPVRVKRDPSVGCNEYLYRRPE